MTAKKTIPDYLTIPSDSSLYRSFSEARSGEISPGGVIWERNIGALDFICVQAWDHSRYLEMAKRHKIPYYTVVDNCPIDAPGGSRLHPHWKGKEDPLPGEDAMDCPPFNSHLDPTEYDQFALRSYQSGADGICIHNCSEGWKSSGRLGHIKEIAERVKTGAIFGQEMVTPMKLIPA